MTVLVTLYEGRNAKGRTNDASITYYTALIERWQKKIIDETFISVDVSCPSFLF
jgi:hypothetical protein